MQHDPAVIAGVCLVAEAAIARAIALSPGTAPQLAQLHPVELVIACTNPTIDVFLVINGDGEINVSSYRETEPTRRTPISYAVFCLKSGCHSIFNRFCIIWINIFINYGDLF